MKIDSAIKLDSSMAAANSPASLTDTIPAQAAMLKTDTDQEPGAQAGGSGRTIENDLYALNVKAEIGGPAAAGSGIVLSSATTKPPAGAPAPQVMRDFPNEITTFLKETVPNAVQKFDGAMQEASLVINGDLTPAEYARASNGGRSVQKLLQQVKHFEGEAEALLQAGRKLKADTAAAEGLHRGWSVSENLKGEALKGLEQKVSQLKQTTAALEAIAGGGSSGGPSGAAVAGRSTASGLRTGIRGSVEGTEHMAEGVRRAMSEGAAEAFAEGAVTGLSGGARAFLGALGEIGLPMLDALMVGIDALAAAAQGKERIKSRNTAEGFSTGLAAGLLEESPDWVRDKLAFHSAAPEITDRVLGAEGLAEKSFNDGLGAGYRFGRSLTPAQKAQWRDAAFQALAAQGYQVSEKNFFSEGNVRKVGAALIPILREAVERARREEAAKAAAERPQRDYYGHNI